MTMSKYIERKARALLAEERSIEGAPYSNAVTLVWQRLTKEEKEVFRGKAGSTVSIRPAAKGQRSLESYMGSASSTVAPDMSKSNNDDSGSEFSDLYVPTEEADSTDGEGRVTKRAYSKWDDGEPSVNSKQTGVEQFTMNDVQHENASIQHLIEMMKHQGMFPSDDAAAKELIKWMT